MKAESYKNLFTGDIRISLKTAASILSTYPASAAALTNISKGLLTSERRRAKNSECGTDIPPLLIVSTTDECNLSCKGCYSCEQSRESGEALSDGRVPEILSEASQLGVSVVMLAGGEPLLSDCWLSAMTRYNDMLGLVFTNGTLLDERRCAWFMEHRHIIPLISIEGGAEQTDARRGVGVFETVNARMDRLRGLGVPFGISLTVTSQNIDSILTRNFNSEYIQKGCRLFVYVEYVPVEAGTEPLALPKSDKKRLSDFAAQSKKQHPALFIAFPGDEEPYGGCLAAGRGFIHISADGAVEPCPFAPFSDVNLKDASLKDALNSDFLARVRENHHLLVEGNGGCALWHNREWLAGLI